MDKVSKKKLGDIASSLEISYSDLISDRKDVFNTLLSKGILLVAPDIKLATRTLNSNYINTPIGRFPKTILHALGLHELFFECVSELLTPTCKQCNCKATQPLSPQNIELPAKGVLALVPVEDQTARGFSLNERCEWLGSERVVVANRLIRIDIHEYQDDATGAPVLCVITGGDRERLIAEVASWFKRGGADLQLLHFESRDAKGQEIARLASSWSCPQCDVKLYKTTTRDLLEASRCDTCSGVGWKADNTGRLIACRECGGIGKGIEIAHQLFGETPLSALLTLSFSELLALIEGRDCHLRRAVSLVNQCGFGSYPLGAPAYALSAGELTLLSVLSGEVSGLAGLVYGLDGAVGDFESPRAKYKLLAERTAVFKPISDEINSTTKFSPLTAAKSSCEVISLRDLRHACLDIPQISFSVGELSGVTAPVGGGATALLTVIAERFSRRNKESHRSSFAKCLKKCSMISALDEGEELAIDSLGLQRVLAKEIARTRGAQELSILEDDLLLPRGRYRCKECLSQENFPGGCELCLGARYDWRVSGLLVGGREVSQIMTQELGELLSCAFAQAGLQRFLDELVRIMPQRLFEGLNLGAKITQLPLPNRRFIRVLAGLLRVLTCLEADSVKPRSGGANRNRMGSGSDLNSELVLVHGPRVMRYDEAKVIYGLLSQLVARGATVIYALIPEQLESAAGKIVKLVEKEGVTWRDRFTEQYFDTRYGLYLTAQEL